VLSYDKLYTAKVQRMGRKARWEEPEPIQSEAVRTAVSGRGQEKVNSTRNSKPNRYLDERGDACDGQSYRCPRKGPFFEQRGGEEGGVVGFKIRPEGAKTLLL